MNTAANNSAAHLSDVSRLRIVVLGYIVRAPLGGFAWHHLQYVMGLARLGHDVYFLEDSGDSPWCCYDPVRNVTDSDPTYGLRFAARTFKTVGLGDRWAYYDAHTARWLGPSADCAVSVCSSADLLLNVSVINPLRPWLREVPVRVLVDTDPVFTQIRILTEPSARSLALGHTAFFSFAGNAGLAQSGIPVDGTSWSPTRQPVCLEAWSVTPGPPDGRFTTIMLWDSYPPLDYEGRHYGVKAESFQPYLDLPAKAGHVFELAIGSSTAPRTLLRRNGWAVRDPRGPTRDLSTYQRFVQQSKAEFSVAKHGYIVTRSGWFSERSTAYLASGRPVLVQDTGFSDWLPTGLGVVPFSTPEQAVAGLEAISSRYELHCRAARAIAEEYFDARKVLSRLIDRAMSAQPGHARH